MYVVSLKMKNNYGLIYFKMTLIMWPLSINYMPLFLIYINDISTTVSNKLLLYADDSVTIASGNTINAIANVFALDLKSIKKLVRGAKFK